MKKESLIPVDAPAPLLEFLLARLPGQSRNSVKHLLSRKQVLVNGILQTRFDYPLLPGQQITLLPRPAGPDLPFPILYEDKALIVVNKPAGLLSVATDTQRERTAFRLVSDLLHRRGSGERPFIVHRLDRDTSGVLLFAKSDLAKRQLQENWNHLVRKRGYWAVVEGCDLPQEGICRSNLMEKGAYRVYSTRHGEGREAITHYHVLSQRKGYSLLDISLDTGRKNQIRVHLSELGHPVAGDQKYNATSDPMGRLALHAYQLSLTCPWNDSPLSITAPPPDGFQRLFPHFFAHYSKG